jgi:hypothetical protein
MTRLFSSFGSITTLLSTTLCPLTTFAFPDLFEPNDTFAQATPLQVGDTARRQYTLHRIDDVDWFKFYAQPGFKYELQTPVVGQAIDVKLELYNTDGTTLLKSVDDAPQGESELLSWRPTAKGFYYLKISDVASSSETCRIDMQYEVRIAAPTAPIAGVLTGVITDASSAQPIPNTTLSSNSSPKTALSNDQGRFALEILPGLSMVTIQAASYQTLTCQIPTTEIFTLSKNFALFPQGQAIPPPSHEQLAFRNGDILKPSQAVYHQGEKLSVALDLHALVEGLCTFYYVGMRSPNQEFYLLTEVINTADQLVPVELATLSFLPPWAGDGNQVINQLAVDNLPRGDYTLYLLRLPTDVEASLSHLEMGELNMANFRIE